MDSPSCPIPENLETFIPADDIAARVRELGAAISRDYAGLPLTLVAIANGAIVFTADLLRAIDIPVQLDSIMLASYGIRTSSSGEVVSRSTLKLNLAGRHVLVVDEILDTGNTLVKVRELLEQERPLSIKFCVLLNKQERRQADLQADYVGFEIPDRFVIGYGLDYHEYCRNLPYVAVVPNL